MIQLKKRPLMITVALLASLGLIAGYFIFNAIPASGMPDGRLGPYSPNRSSSDPVGAHTFLMRKNNLGKNTQLQISAYYPVDVDWGQEYIYIDPYLSCDVDFDSDANSSGPVTYMSVAITAGSVTDTYNIKIDRETGLNNVCTVTDGRVNYTGDNGTNRNKLFARYPLPGSRPAVDGGTNRLKVIVEIRYNDIVTTPIKSDAHNNQQRFQVRAQTRAGGSYGDNSRALIGPTGGNDGGLVDSKFNYPILGRPEYYGSPTQISVPFGLPCNATSSQIKRVGIYDADNFPGSPVRFKVQDMGDGDSSPTYNVPFRNGFNQMPGTRTSGNFRDDWFTPTQDNAEKSYVEITMEPDHQYQIQVINVDGGNTIVVNVPTETIYGVIGCGWKMSPSTSVFPSTQEPGRTVTFYHNNKNIGAFDSAVLDTSARWTTGGDRPVRTSDTGIVSIAPSNPIADKIYSAGGPGRDIDVVYRIPAGATAGTTYCQYTRSSLWKSTNRIIKDSEPPACVTVRAPPPPATDRVNISPNVPDSATYIEPTEQVTLNGQVNISNFPRPEDGGWGYNERSQQRPAQRVRATSENRLETDSDSVAATANTTYSCPHGADTRSGSTCTHTYSGNANDTRAECEANGHNWSGGSCTDTHAANSNTTYSCPNSTYIRSGTTCSRTRYRCQGSTTWGTWNASPPNCTYWTCPGGASGSGYRTTEPTCIGWKCQYSDAIQVNTVAAPTCEYRCSGGIGARAYLDRDNGDGSDRRCFVEPTFVLSCQWQDGTVTNETVRFGTSVYCSGSKTLTGQTIGVPVCARITADHNATWTGSPQPGWTVNTAGVQRQLKVWGWSATPVSDSGCARVVGKPTVKIFGGDIAAGGDFIRNGVCNPVAAAQIAGWPHAPNYNASGTQFGAYSSSSITGFSSAMINANNAVAPRSLAFANFPASGGDTFGGGFDNNMPCAKDHYNDATPASLPNIGMPSINSNPIIPTPSGSYQGSGGQINQSPTIRNGQRIAVYATGNVYISGSGIRYNRTGWIRTQDIPAFKLVVYGGNIYIAPSVTELSGTYVAQPNGAVGGNIYTCANNGSLIADTSLYGSCQNPLTVNGTFIAKKVHLQRTQGTAIRGETAERFNYLPELWLTSWPTTSSATEIKYDAIISLPPVL